MKVEIIDTLTFVSLEEVEIKTNDVGKIIILTSDPENTKVVMVEK